MTAPQISKRDAVVSLAVSLAPIVVMVLMTKPALVQSMKMKAALVARNFCVQQTQFWQDASFRTARWFTNASL